MPTTTTSGPNQPTSLALQARAFIDQAKDALLIHEQNLARFIATRGWIYLDYPSFADCYAIEFSGAEKISEARSKARIVYQLLDEGLSIDDIIDLTGIMDHTVANIARQKKDGVPAAAVVLPRRVVAPKNQHGNNLPAPHSRSNPGPITHLELTFDMHVLAWMKRVAAVMGVDLKDLGQQLLLVEVHQLNRTAQVTP